MNFLLYLETSDQQRMSRQPNMDSGSSFNDEKGKPLSSSVPPPSYEAAVLQNPQNQQDGKTQPEVQQAVGPAQSPPKQPPPQKSILGRIDKFLQSGAQKLNDFGDKLTGDFVDGTNRTDDLTPEIMHQRIAENGSFLGLTYDTELIDIRKFLHLITGNHGDSYHLSGADFANISYNKLSLRCQVKEDYESLRLDFQFFWDMMLRMTPNTITKDFNSVRKAADLMMDLVAGQLAFRTRDDCTPEIAQQQVRELRRRLQHQTLYLRQDMWNCKQDSDLLCSCGIANGRKEGKREPWTGFFDLANPRSEGSIFSVRDFANLQDLDDFLTCLSEEFEKTYGNGQPRALEHQGYQGTKFFDEEITKMMPSNIGSDGELREFWLKMLCGEEFRKLVHWEVWKLRNEAKVHNKAGFLYKKHKKNCPK